MATTAIGLTACPYLLDNLPPQESQTITISGKPISVAYTSSTNDEFAKFAGVFEVDGKLLLTYSHGADGSRQVAKAAAIVLSEINDRDDELVNMTGKYTGNEFQLSSVQANGYKIDFNN